MIFSARLGSRLLFPSSPLRSKAGRLRRGERTHTLVDVTPARAGWKYIRFAVRQLAPDEPWTDDTRANECCLVLLRGRCHVEYTVSRKTHVATLGPRRDVFVDYPHAIYLPPRTRFRISADDVTEIADGRARARKRFEARVIRPEDCGFEVRGGGNATRQIIDIMPPSFAADRLLLCEVLTPSGNWSSYPPHKHDTDRPPGEVKLEEIYYYRFAHQEAYGFQRLYGRHDDRTLMVKHGDVVTIREGYHPFVTAYGYNAYYLNVLAGTRRSMAASDDPRYAALRAWPPPESRVPLIPPPPR
jgi:5-deoxy-glucuronate isomerase